MHPRPPPQVLLYTVDGASLLPVVRGSLQGAGLLTTVDFGPTTDVAAAFALQKRWGRVLWGVRVYVGWFSACQIAVVVRTMLSLLWLLERSSNPQRYVWLNDRVLFTVCHGAKYRQGGVVFAVAAACVPPLPAGSTRPASPLPSVLSTTQAG
jgi:hypothetical protein